MSCPGDRGTAGVAPPHQTTRGQADGRTHPAALHRPADWRTFWQHSLQGTSAMTSRTFRKLSACPPVRPSACPPGRGAAARVRPSA